MSKELLKNIVGWGMSVALHVGVVIAAWYGLPYLKRPEIAPPPPIEIEFVAIAEQTRQVTPQEVVEQEQTVEEPKPTYAAAEAAEPEPDDSVPMPTPEEKPEPVIAPKPKPKPEVSETRKLADTIRPRSKPKPPSRLNISKLKTALIDRSVKEEQEQARQDEKDREEKRKQEEEQKRKSAFAALQGRLATASLVDALSQKIGSCWNPPPGAKGVGRMTALIQVHLRADGTVARRPRFISGGDLSDGFYKVFVESAIRAALTCGPYEDEAKALYDMGNTYIDLNFDPRNMGLE